MKIKYSWRNGNEIIVSLGSSTNQGMLTVNLLWYQQSQKMIAINPYRTKPQLYILQVLLGTIQLNSAPVNLTNYICLISSIFQYVWYAFINESFINIGLLFVVTQACVECRRPWSSTAKAFYSSLGVCEWSPEGLYDKSVSWIPNTDEILKLVKKKMNYWLQLADTQAWSCRSPWHNCRMPWHSCRRPWHSCRRP